MKKEDLKPGVHVVKLRNGNRCLVLQLNTTIPENRFISGVGAAISLLAYDSDLKHYLKKEELDIVEVFVIDCNTIINNLLKTPLPTAALLSVWKREEVKEVTMDQVAKVFGTTVDKLRIKK